MDICCTYNYKLPLPLVFLLIGGSPIDATPSPPPKTTYNKILAQKLRSECLPTLEEMITLQGYFAIPDQPVQETFPWMFVSRQDGQHPSTLWTTNFPKLRIWFICYGGHWDFPCGKKCMVRSAMAVVPTNFGLLWNSSQALALESD